MIYEVVSGGKADFSVLKPIPPQELRNEIITLEEAYEDKEFGAFIPMDFPSRYYFNEAHRFINQGANYLIVSLSEGYNDIRWRISSIEEEDKRRITSVKDTEKYDVNLYSIPTADSVPKDLQEIVDNPIFLIEELTSDEVKMRSYTLNEQGDISGERMRFSVLYGEILVEVSTKGVTPEELYEMVKKIK